MPVKELKKDADHRMKRAVENVQQEFVWYRFLRQQQYRSQNRD